MGVRSEKNLKKINLQQMSDCERIQLIKEVREKLQQKSTEEKLWQSLVEVENLTINGSIIYREGQQLTGFSFKERV